MSGGRAVVPLLAVVLGVAAMLLPLSVALFDGGSAESAGHVLDSEFRPRSVAGHLTIAGYGAAGRAGPATEQVTTFVNGPDYAGMEDNDLRGFLDGSFKLGWSQVSQVHVRIGRRFDGEQWGEHELFRVVQRWDDIRLPPAANVLQARLRLRLEAGPGIPLTVMLYAVNKDWNPGQGGTLGNNTSPPLPGEAWWGDAEFEKRPWGLPGAGYANARDPEADTDISPLAEAAYETGAKSLEFSGDRLAQYVARQIEAHEPVRFLLKVSDQDEDQPGRWVQVFSGNTGDDRNVVTRPALTVTWTAASELEQISRDIYLEYGRSQLVEFDPGPDVQTMSAAFTPDSAAPAPWLTYRECSESGRECSDSGWSDWRRLKLPVKLNGGRVQVKVAAVHDPVTLGSAFETRLKDPFLTTAPPEQQRVPWRFVSPGGEVTQVPAEYLGDYVWGIQFVPAELGRWRYSWTQEFTTPPYASEEGSFDVVAGDLDNINQQLAVLLSDIEEAGETDSERRYQRFETRFLALQRAAMRELTPRSYRNDIGAETRRLMNDVRGAIGGEPVPVPMPFKTWDRDF